ncbi:MAG: hypothetical protein LUC31_03505 [Coprobacillus sp.]|nr:hypothetical protein [Coprobacillus sp.]
MDKEVIIDNSKRNEHIFRIVNYILMIVCCLTCVGIGIYYAVAGDVNQRMMVSFVCAVVILLPMILDIILIHTIKRSIPNGLLLIISLYFILAAIVGAALNVYYTVSFYDIIVHVVMGYFVALLGMFILSCITDYYKVNVVVIALFCFFFALAVELVWELGEWAFDCWFGGSAQGEVVDGYNAPLVTDTMEDILCNFSGAAIFLIHFLVGRLTKCSLGIKQIEKITILEKRQREEVK